MSAGAPQLALRFHSYRGLAWINATRTIVTNDFKYVNAAGFRSQLNAHEALLRCNICFEGVVG